MIKITPDDSADDSDIEYPSDCRYLQKRLLVISYLATLQEVQDFWRWYSQTYAAGWMTVYENNDNSSGYLDDDYLNSLVSTYLEEND